jgi:hypothetical protein
LAGEIWQPGFTDHRIRDEQDWNRHLEYIRQNPIEARLVEKIELYELLGFPSMEFPQGLKPTGSTDDDVRAEARTLHAQTNRFEGLRNDTEPCHAEMTYKKSS